MSGAVKNLVRLGAVAVGLVAAGGLAWWALQRSDGPARPPVVVQIPNTCGPEAIGVKRYIELSPTSDSLFDLLKPGEVVLTFDDGPDPVGTPAVLQELGQECTRATFFLLGKAADARPDLVREIIAHGHTVGSHSWDHTYLPGRSIRKAVANARRAADAVDAATGQHTPFFRYPFVAATVELSQAIRDEGLIEIWVTADGNDWNHNTPEEATGLILSKLEAADRRGIIVLHDPVKASAKRTRHLLHALKENGYQVVALQAAGG